MGPVQSATASPSPWCSGWGVVLRVLGFGYLIAGRRGPILLVALLVVTTLLAWTPWAAVTALPWVLGSPSRAGSGLPRWQLLALGMVLFLGAGSAPAGSPRPSSPPRVRAEGWAQTSEFNRAQLLPRTPREALGAVMATVADGDTSAACFLFIDPARAQLAAAWGAPDCPGAVAAWHSQVTRPADYTTSVELVGVTTTTSPDRESATVTGCALTWNSPSTASTRPPAPPPPPRPDGAAPGARAGLPDHRLPALLTPPRPAAR